MPPRTACYTCFQLITADHVTELSEKNILCFDINEGWCTEMTVLKKMWSPNLEVLFIILSLFIRLAPRNFLRLFWSHMCRLHSSKPLRQHNDNKKHKCNKKAGALNLSNDIFVYIRGHKLRIRSNELFIRVNVSLIRYLDLGKSRAGIINSFPRLT